ncbi:response regulator transcription factor [Microbispora sp. NBRC 16548]|uniref:response regulator n=1 Tax=Microbispora sp. NBRC 16548 TaxID=3030994 RepID=UPI00160755F9|nr:response regulator transcription factor [Microbispora sp. NBRC 16548]GLX06215.1 DNA-binding response regulator [Microbispora sp. NBRC 16548]
MIRVLLADDQELVRLGLRMILEAQEDVEVVAEAGDGEQAVREALLHRPDVVLLDIRMPGMDGIAAARRILADSRLAIRVIMLTTFDRDEYLYAALNAGACGFLLKSTPRAHLLHAVRTAVHGEALLDPVLTRRIVEEHAARRPAEVSDRLDVLTGRELDVLRQLAYGRSNAEIAAALNLAETTVKTHVAAVLRKLDLRGRVQAVILGYETGLVRPGDNPAPR